MEVSESSFILNTHDLTSDIKMNEINVQEGGCFTSYTCNEINNLILQAFTSKKPDVVCFLLENIKTKIDKLDMKDKHERTFLHYFILYNNYEIINQYLIKILKNKDICSVRDAINAQDVLGNTPLHYALMIQNDMIINLLIERGANKKIKNNEGSYIDTENNLHDQNQTQTQTQTDNNSAKKNIKKDIEDIDMSNSDIFISEVQILDNDIVDRLRYNINLKPRDATDSFVFNPSTMRNTMTKNTMTEEIATDDIANAIIAKMRNDGGSDDKDDDKGKGEGDNKDDDEYKGKGKDNNLGLVELTVLPRVSEPEALTVNTDEIINALQKSNPQAGGKKSKKSKKSKGSRKLRTYSEFSFGSEGAFGDPINTAEDLTESTEQIGLELLKLNAKKTEKSETESDEDKTLEKKLFEKTEKSDEKSEEKSEDTIEVQSELSEMARSIARQSTEIHERVIKKIAELLKLDLNNPEDNKKARYYKATIWKQITTKHPELSNFDRAVEMEKKVTKDYLKTIDINKVTKELDEYFSEKESKPKEERKEKVKEEKKDKVKEEKKDKVKEEKKDKVKEEKKENKERSK